MNTPYRINAREHQYPEPLSWSERFSCKLIGHPNLFTNMLIMSLIGIPIWLCMATIVCGIVMLALYLTTIFLR
jgi:isoprenylcysteine carboxyl methyltransferase (ICMT) family protein YpbQ